MTVGSRAWRWPFHLGASMVAAAMLACDGSASPLGLGSPQVSIAGDTVPGTGALAELQQRRAAWVARGIDDYRVQLQITCFCGGDITRPVLLEVRGGAAANAWDLATAKPREILEGYPTITGLFDAAIAERARGGNVSVSYDRTFGFPVRLEIGTIANDAGTLYLLGELRPL